MKVKKCINNQVFVKIKVENDKIKTKSGITLFMDTSYELEKHTDIICEVVNVPDKYSFVIGGQKQEWDTDIEIKPGDTVWTTYLQVRKNYDQGAYFKEGDDVYFMFIDYSSLVMAKRGDDIIMLNGYCMVRPVLEKKKSNLFLDPEKKYGEIVLCGTPNKRYKMKRYNDDADTMVGDVVSFDKYADIPIEYKDHQTLDGEYWKIQRRHMRAVVNVGEES